LREILRLTDPQNALGGNPAPERSPTINLHDVPYVVRDGVPEDVWPITSRGRME
jgi:hypothetical protein